MKPVALCRLPTTVVVYSHSGRWTGREVEASVKHCGVTKGTPEEACKSMRQVNNQKQKVGHSMNDRSNGKCRFEMK